MNMRWKTENVPNLHGLREISKSMRDGFISCTKSRFPLN